MLQASKHAQSPNWAVSDDPDHLEPGSKRRRFSSDVTNLSAPAIAQRIIPPESGRKARQKDYDTEAQHVLNRAIPLFKFRVVSDTAYPDTLMERIWAKEAWYQAVADLNAKLTPDTGVISVVRTALSSPPCQC